MMTPDKSPEGHTKLSPETSIPDNLTSVYVDKILVTSFDNMETATLSLLVHHTIPKITKDGWTIDRMVNDLVGELKMPKSELLDFCIYYITQITGGLDLRTQIHKYMYEHPKDPSINFGPSITRTESL